MRSIVATLLLCSPAFASEPAYSWQTNPNDPDRIYLYQDGRQIGGWCYSAKHYRSFDGTSWGPPTEKAPVQPPANRVVPRPQQRLVMTPPITPTRPLRGPLRVRAGTIFAETMMEGTLRVFEAIPGAILDSVKQGNYKLEFKSTVTPSSPPQEPIAPPKSK